MRPTRAYICRISQRCAPHERNLCHIPAGELPGWSALIRGSGTPARKLTAYPRQYTKKVPPNMQPTCTSKGTHFNLKSDLTPPPAACSTHPDPPAQISHQGSDPPSSHPHDSRNPLQLLIWDRNIRMHSEIRLRDIFLPQDRNLIVPRDHLFPIRIIHRTVLRPAVTSITDRKMRSPSSPRQDRQPVQDPELLRHRIRRRVRSDRKLAERAGSHVHS